MSDDAVWAEGLKCFYEIFKFLEEALDRLGHTLLGELDVEGMRRTKAFEQDLEFYCIIQSLNYMFLNYIINNFLYCIDGKNYLENVYQPSSAVIAYVEYLTTLEAEDPHMLAAYIYHLYVGLFSGGQILRKKRSLEASLKFKKSTDTDSTGKAGEAVTDFVDIHIFKLKKQMMEAMERVAAQLGEQDRWKLIEESKNVFRMNNKMIRTISTNKVVLRKFTNFVLVAVPTVLAIYFGSRMITHRN